MNHTNQQGFTLVELLATIVIAAIFLVSAYQLVHTVSLFSITSSQQTIADELAYANLRQYANGSSPTWFTCIPASPVTNPSTFDTLENIITDVDDLPSPVVQVVRANAPYGCSGSASGLPIYVESYVTYGPTARKVTHATYVSY